MMREDWSIISSCELIPYVCMASPAGLKIPETIEEANAYQTADDAKIQRMHKIHSTNAWRIKNDDQGRIKFTPCSKDHNDAFINKPKLIKPSTVEKPKEAVEPMPIFIQQNLFQETTTATGQ